MFLTNARGYENVISDIKIDRQHVHVFGKGPNNDNRKEEDMEFTY